MQGRLAVAEGLQLQQQQQQDDEAAADELSGPAISPEKTKAQKKTRGPTPPVLT
eukprot:gene8308-1550_t